MEEKAKVKAKAEDDRDLIGTIGRCVNTLRDAILTALMVFGAFVLWQLWPQIQLQLKNAPVEEVGFFGALTVKLKTETVTSFGSNSVPLDAVGGFADITEKGGSQELQAAISKGGRIDMLGISSGQQYVGELLLAYISRLAPRFVIFREGDRLDEWIDASLFAAQISHPNQNYSYEMLRLFHGVRKETISKEATARDALEMMQKSHLDHLPAVDNNHRFQFMLSRDEILAKVITSVVLPPPQN
jgi:hypothetical protein